MKKALYILFAVLFFLACLIPSAGLLIKGPGEAAANEAPVPAPRLRNRDGSWNGNVLGELTDYVGKGFFLRLESITAWDALCAGLFRTSGNDDVLLGPDGWLFYGAAAEELSGADRMTDRQLWCAARSLFLMEEYAQSRGAAFLFTVPCGKYTVYPDHAPAYAAVAEDSNRALLAGLLGEMGVSYGDMYPAFSAAAEEDLYWKQDSHWNGKGAALGADVILRALGRESDFAAGPFRVTGEHTGDLYAMLYPAGTATEPEYAPAAGWSFAHIGDFHTCDDMTITTECPGKAGSLLMFRDSSGRNLYPYLAESFGRAVFSRMNSYDLTLLDDTAADTVVIELAERTLDYLLRYPAIVPAPLRDASLLGDMTPVEGEITAVPGPEGYTKLTGGLPAAAADSPVYLAAGTAVYEAIPGPESFTAYLPSEIDAASVRVYVRAE